MLAKHQIDIAGQRTIILFCQSTELFQNGGSQYDRTNFLLMHAMGPNVAGVIGSAVAAGFFLIFFG